MKKSSDRHEICVGDAFVTVRHRGCGAVTVAGVLGRERLPEGGLRIYLDRLIHQIEEDFIGDWRCSGAVSTILEHAPEAAMVGEDQPVEQVR